VNSCCHACQHRAIGTACWDCTDRSVILNRVISLTVPTAGLAINTIVIELQTHIISKLYRQMIRNVPNDLNPAQPLTEYDAKKGLH